MMGPAAPDADPSALELPEPRSRTVGDLRIHTIEAGLQRLDGGAMFGVVPKPLWERRIPADPRNRIPLALRCLLVETPDTLLLVDTGVGNKEDEKFRDIYGIENAGDPTRLEDGIRRAGFRPEDVQHVVLTHLHFDHAGGATVRRDDGTVTPSFPWARYVVQRGELEFARRDNERIRASYITRNFDAVTDAGLWDLVEGETELVPGVNLIPTPGHTPHHQSVLLHSAGDAVFFAADLCPTAAHLPLPWIMGYDLEPLVTLESKRESWRRALEEEWLVVFQHDPVTVWGHLHEDGRSLREAR